MCVLVPQGESDDTRTLLQLPVFRDVKPGELRAVRIQKLLDVSFPLTATDRSREDDISLESLRGKRADAARRKHDCFRNLFEAERCPAPFVRGSRFYCFHCPGTHGAAGALLRNSQASELEKESAELLLLPSVPLCSAAERGEGRLHEGQSEEEEKLAIMYERLQMEVRGYTQLLVSQQM